MRSFAYILSFMFLLFTSTAPTKAQVKHSKIRKYSEKGKMEKLFEYIEELPGSETQEALDYAVIAALRYGKLDMVMALVEEGADINTEHSSNILISSKNNHTAIPIYLVRNGANCDAREWVYQLTDGELPSGRGATSFTFEKARTGHSALSYAVKNGNLKMAQGLLENNCNPNLPIVAQGLSMGGMSFSVVDGSPDFTANFGEGAYLTSRYNHVNTNIEIKYWKTTPIILAINHQEFEIMELLLEYGADIFLEDSYDRDAIQTAYRLDDPCPTAYKIFEYYDGPTTISELFFSWAKTASKYNRHEKALLIYSELLEIEKSKNIESKKLSSIYQLVGMTKQDMEDYDGSIEDFRNSISIYKATDLDGQQDLGLKQFLLALSLEKTGDLKGAIIEYQKAADLFIPESEYEDAALLKIDQLLKK